MSGAWSCAVLVAGASRRLGRPKQLVPVDGRPLVRHVVERVREAGASRVAVVVGAHGEAVAGAVVESTVDVLWNREWQEGMASSIRVAVAWAAGRGDPALALVLGDQPAITAAHLDGLAARLAPGVAAVGSAYGGVAGVPAIFDASLFWRLMALRSDRGAARVLAEVDAPALEWLEGAIDIDTEEDLAAWHASSALTRTRER